MSRLGQKHRFDRQPLTSGVPRSTDVLRAVRQVSKVPAGDIQSSADQWEFEHPFEEFLDRLFGFLGGERIVPGVHAVPSVFMRSPSACSCGCYGNNGCYYDNYGQLICPQQYPYQY
jgi:hypothetical protein